MQPGTRRVVAAAVALPFGLWMGWLGLMWSGQRMVLFPGVDRAVPAFGAPADAVVYEVRVDDAVVPAWFLPALSGEGPRPLVVYTHGNGELIHDWPAGLRPWRDAGAHVLLVEYPGYGDATGRPSQQSIGDVLERAYDLAVVRDDVDGAAVIAHGRSLGGGAACELARRRPIAGLALTSTFTSVRSMAARFAAPGFAVRDPFDNLSLVRSFDGPVVVAHGVVDEVVPFAHGERLAAAASDGVFVALDGGHNDVDMPWPELIALLDRVAAVSSR